MAASSDTGLYGPDSVTWRVHVDPSMWIAAFSALALQSLHPRTMWGTYQNSQLFDRSEAVARLFRTAHYVSARTFGTTAEAERFGRGVRSIHARLTGIDEDTGERFRVDDPDNLRWVHCAEIACYLRVARLAGVHLTDAEADAYVDEQRRSAGLVGLDPAQVPASVDELADYFASVRPHLRLTRTATRGILTWVNTPAPRRLVALRLVYPLLGALGVALLPGWARRHYRLPSRGLSGRAVAFGGALGARVVRRIMIALPERYTATHEQQTYLRHAKRLMDWRGLPSSAA